MPPPHVHELLAGFQRWRPAVQDGALVQEHGLQDASRADVLEPAPGTRQDPLRAF